MADAGTESPAAVVSDVYRTQRVKFVFRLIRPIAVTAMIATLIAPSNDSFQTSSDSFQVTPLACKMKAYWQSVWIVKPDCSQAPPPSQPPQITPPDSPEPNPPPAADPDVPPDTQHTP